MRADIISITGVMPLCSFHAPLISGLPTPPPLPPPAQKPSHADAAFDDFGIFFGHYINSFAVTVIWRDALTARYSMPRRMLVILWMPRTHAKRAAAMMRAARKYADADIKY